MNIIWLTNSMPPVVARTLGIKEHFKEGWLDTPAKWLIGSEHRITFLFPNRGEDIDGDEKDFSYKGICCCDEETFVDIIKKTNPDIVHIWGTEMLHTLAMVNACEKLDLLDKIVINIQGLVHICGKYHYFADLPQNEIYGGTEKDYKLNTRVFQGRNDFLKRGKEEIITIKKAKNFIGRTDWDYACVKQVNPSANYYFCNEMLREEFYNYSWKLDDCEKFSIFVSQCSYPIKGFHYMLEAMSEVVKRFPKAHIYTTGINPLSFTGENEYNIRSYRKYIKKLMIKYNLEDKITFLGTLQEKEMCQRFLKSHVFVSPSSIENSSNSIGEAMLLGVPVVASYVGGTSNILEDKKEGFLYQHNAPYMLSHYICTLFENDDIAEFFSKEAKKRARMTHSMDINNARMIEIYNEIVNKGEL